MKEKGKNVCILDMIKVSFVLCLSTMAAGLATGAQEAPIDFPRQGATQEIWEKQRGQTVEDMTQTGAFKKGEPTRTAIVSSLDAGSRGEEYGARYSALLTVPKSGTYTFWIAADDTAELWLSPDSDPAKMEKIADRKGYSPVQTFRDDAKSQPVQLEQGKNYYIQVLHKQAGGNDHVSVAWQGDGMPREILGGANLKPILDVKRKKSIEQTVRFDQHKNELHKDLQSQNEQTVAAWMDKLPGPDKKLVADILRQEEKSLVARPSEERKDILKTYATLARGIVPTVENPITNPAAKRLLYLEEKYLESLTPQELKDYGPHRLSNMLGEIPSGIKPGKKIVSLDSKGDKWDREMVSTSVYALPGVPVTVILPDELTKSGLELIIGHHVNAGVHQDPALLSTPNTTRHFPLNAARTTAISPHGGLVFIQVPKTVALSKTPITFENVIAAPRFVLGKTSVKAWEKLREAPAPWGELISENVLLLVKSDDLRKLNNPTALMKWWNENCRRHQDFYAYYPGYPFRMHASLYPREGYAYWPLEWQPKNMVRLLDLDQMKAKNDGLFLHEHGHHGDPDEMVVGYWGESTCNWAGYYMKSLGDFDWKDSPDTHMRKLFDPADKAHEEIKQEGWYAISTKGTHHWSYPITSMMLGQTVDFGWKPIKETIRRMRNLQDSMYKWDFVQGDMKDQVVRDQAKIDRYLIGLSEGAKRDVRPYFEHFKLRPSAGAASYLDKKAFPKWDLSYLPMDKEPATGIDSPLTIPNPEQSILSMAGPTKITWNSRTDAGGSVKVTPAGDVVYTPRKGFSGTDRIAYILKNTVGASPVKYLPVNVGK